MAGTAANVSAGVVVGGAVYSGATSASAPTATTSTLTGFTDNGYISEDGVKITPSIEIKDIKDGFTGGSVATVPTGGKVEISFTLIENDEVSRETYHGTSASLAAAGAGYIEFKPTTTGGVKSWVIDAVNQDGTTFDRYYIARAELTGREPIEVGIGSSPMYGITLTCHEVSQVAYKKFSTALTA